MSLINQMLRDLESRRTPSAPAQVLPGQAGENAAGKTRRLLLLLSLLVALLALILAYLVWERFAAPSAIAPFETGVRAAAPPSTPLPQTPAKNGPPSPAKPPVTSKTTPQPLAARPLVAPAPVAAAAPRPQLLAIEPQLLSGSWEKQRLTLKGRNLTPGSRVELSWDGKRKILPSQRVHWRDSSTLEVEIVTGIRASQWSVALADGQGEPLFFKVAAAPAQTPTQQKAPSTLADNQEDAGPVVDIEKHIRPLRPEQAAEKAYQEGYLQLQRGNRDGAEKQWREALRHDPRHIASREGLAGLYLNQGRNVEATELLAEGLTHHPGYGQFALLYARMQVQNGKPASALATLETALEKQPQTADFLAFLAALYQQQKMFVKSVAAYQQALAMQPRNSIWWMGIGISLEGEGKAQEAISAYNEAEKSGSLPPKLLRYVQGRLAALE